MDRRRLGERGEDIALMKLQNSGMKLLEKNYRAQRKEIDLVMRDGECIVFVEVKARTNHRFGSGLEAVTPRKQKNIILAARHFLAENGLTEEPVRFDVVEVSSATGEVTHIKDAFIE